MFKKLFGVTTTITTKTTVVKTNIDPHETMNKLTE